MVISAHGQGHYAGPLPANTGEEATENSLVHPLRDKLADTRLPLAPPTNPTAKLELWRN